MYILHIITRGDVNGGAQAHIIDLSKEQVIQGHKVAIICGKSSQSFDTLSSLGVNIFCLNDIRRQIHPYYDVVAIIKIIKIIRKEKPQIIACHTSKAGVIGRFAAVFSKAKTVYTPHSWIFSEPSYAKKIKTYIKIEKFMAKLCHKIITVSENDFKIANKIKIKKCITIHNGMADIDTALIKKDYNIEDKVKLIIVARLEEPKDLSSLFKALEQLKGRKWQLNIFGDGSLRTSLENECKQLEISNQVTFHGDCQNINEQLFNSDIFILISKSEGFPISIIEAMRAGLPVIASTVGGIPEAVKHNENGLLVDNNILNSLVIAIDQLLSNPKEIEKLGRDGRMKYEKLLTAKIMSDKTLELYNNVLIG
jgi:glycosyltransferase involved in cell wall biosynthesis